MRIAKMCIAKMCIGKTKRLSSEPPLVVSHRNTKAPFLLHRGASFRRTGNQSSDVALLVYCILFQDVLHICSKRCNKKRHHTNCSTLRGRHQ
jgi:hypothetical protein